jgi:hypothetical protein
MEGNARNPRALVISFSNLGADPRVHRQIALLAQRFEVTAAGHAPPGIPGVKFCQVPSRHWTGLRKLAAAALLKLGRFEQVYRSSLTVRTASAALTGERFSLIVANDILALPLALSLRNGAKVLFDAHEYAPLEFEENWKWRFFLWRFNEYLCRHYAPRSDAATTVCNGIAQEYHRLLGIRMTVIHNAPPFERLEPRPGTPTDAIRLVHHGGAISSRQLETMIESMRYLDDRFSLDLVLVPSEPRYLGRLKSLASGNRRIRFLPPVAMHEIPRFLNQYDAGVYLLPPNNFNNRHSLPNKFFDFVQARLAIVIGPSPEMAVYVTRYGMGVVSEDFTPRSFAHAISGLDRERIARFKAQAHLAARELCFERSAESLTAVIDGLLASTCAG